jgi:hypothetical protein
VKHQNAVTNILGPLVNGVGLGFVYSRTSSDMPSVRIRSQQVENTLDSIGLGSTASTVEGSVEGAFGSLRIINLFVFSYAETCPS